MRTTLTIDDDVLAVAKGFAQQHKKSVGEVLSALARQGLKPAAASRKTRNGVPLLPGKATGNTPVTMALVNQLQNELP